MYDYIICGAGIAGLYTAYRLLKKNPDLKILIIFEKLGGKLSTATIPEPTFEEADYTKPCSFELGAFRFLPNHTKLRSLISELDLDYMVCPFYAGNERNVQSRTCMNIEEKKDNDGYYKRLGSVDSFNISTEMNSILRAIESFHLDENFLTKLTFYNLLKIHIYPYIYTGYKCTYDELPRLKKSQVKNRLTRLIYSHGIDYEFTALNAAVALLLFRNYYPNPDTKFKMLHPERGGFTQLVSELIARMPNVTFRKMHVTNINLHDRYVHAREIRTGGKHARDVFSASKEIIIALPVENVREIVSRQQFTCKDGKIMRLNADFNPFSNLVVAPLCVIHFKAKFDLVTNAPDTVTTMNNPIKYLIPINLAEGRYMIYCDAKVAKGWGEVVHNRGEHNVMINIQHFLEEAGFKCQVLWSVTTYWANAAAYWKAGINPLKISKKMLRYNFVGSSFAVNQNWIEGTLAHVDTYLSNLKK